jgi:DNA-3-methyladenine glycosylase I
MKTKPEAISRCQWVGDNPLYLTYHDNEWGTPVHDDRQHFEFLVLEGAQAGLSWLTILKRRDGYRRAYRDFDPGKVAKFDEADVNRLLSDEGIIRNQAKIRSSINNAKTFLKIQDEFGSFDKYIWRWTNGQPYVSGIRQLADYPARTELSDKVSTDLKKRGMSFVGSTIIYAHLQATGIVNDHMAGCFKFKELSG